MEQYKFISELNQKSDNFILYLEIYPKQAVIQYVELLR